MKRIWREIERWRDRDSRKTGVRGTVVLFFFFSSFLTALVVFIQPIQGRATRAALKRCEPECRASMADKATDDLLNGIPLLAGEDSETLKGEIFEIEITNCVRRCVSPACYERLYGSDPVRKGNNRKLGIERG